MLVTLARMRRTWWVVRVAALAVIAGGACDDDSEGCHGPAGPPPVARMASLLASDTDYLGTITPVSNVRLRATGGVQLYEALGGPATSAVDRAAQRDPTMSFHYRCTDHGTIEVFGENRSYRSDPGPHQEHLRVTVDITCVRRIVVLRGITGIDVEGEDAIGAHIAGAPIDLVYTISHGDGAPRSDANEPSDLLKVAPVAVGATDNCAAEIITPAPRDLDVDESFEQTIRVTALAPGAFTCRILVPSSDSKLPTYPFDITGTGLAGQPAIVVTGAHGPILDGGTEDAGEQAAGQAFPNHFTITNTGTGDLALGAIATLPGNNCTATVTAAPAATVPPGGTTTLTVTATAPQRGSFSCPVSIANNDPDQHPFDFAITGTALAPLLEVSRDGQLLESQEPDDAGERLVGAPFLRSYSIHNSGTATMTVGPVTEELTANCTFAVVTPPSDSVPSTELTVLQVEVTPALPGPFTCALSFTTNAPGQGVFVLPITGMAVLPPAPDIVLSSQEVIAPGGTEDTGMHPVGVTFTAAFTIANPGDAPLVVQDVVFGGSPSCDALVAIVTPTTVPPGMTTAFTIAITPLVVGPFTCPFTIPNNVDGKETYPFTVTGIGTGPEITVIGPGGVTGDGALTDAVGEVPAGSAFTRAYDVRNVGNAALVVSHVDVHLPTRCTITVTTDPSGTIAPGAAAPLVVSVTPEVGAFACAVRIHSDDPDEPVYTVHVTGTGVGQPRVGFRLRFDEPFTGTEVVLRDTDDDGAGNALIHTGLLTAGEDHALQLEVRSTGDAPAEVEVDVSGDGCELVAPPPPVLEPGEAAIVDVIVSPPALGPTSCNLDIFTNAPDAPGTRFVLAGTGTSPLGSFPFAAGRYTGTGCGITTLDLVVGEQIVVTIPNNPPMVYGLVSPDVAFTGGPVNLFSSPTHTARITRTSPITLTFFGQVIGNPAINCTATFTRTQPALRIGTGTVGYLGANVLEGQPLPVASGTQGFHVFNDGLSNLNLRDITLLSAPDAECAISTLPDLLFLDPGSSTHFVTRTLYDLDLPPGPACTLLIESNDPRFIPIGRFFFVGAATDF